MPNAGHGLDGGKENALKTLAVFAQHVAMQEPLPNVSWKHDDDGDQMRLVVHSAPAPKAVRLWTAHSEDKDFRPAHWDATPITADSDGAYVAHVAKPASGHVAFFAEATHEFGPLEYGLSTQMRQNSRRVAQEHGTVTIPQFTWQDYERDFADRHLLHAVVAKWAREAPDQTAIIEFDTGREVTYRQFDDRTTALALRLIEWGYRPGDYLATLLPLTVEHIFLEYACFKIGVVHAPLDMRLKPDEVVRSLDLIQAKGVVMPGRTPAVDFTPIAEAVRVVVRLCRAFGSDRGCRSSASKARSRQRRYSKSGRRLATIQRWFEITRRQPAGFCRPTAPKSSIRRAQPAFLNRPCFRIATSRCKIFAWPAGAAGSIFGECWSICRRRTLVAKAKS